MSEIIKKIVDVILSINLRGEKRLTWEEKMVMYNHWCEVMDKGGAEKLVEAIKSACSDERIKHLRKK